MGVSMSYKVGRRGGRKWARKKEGAGLKAQDDGLDELGGWAQRWR